MADTYENIWQKRNCYGEGRIGEWALLIKRGKQ